MRRNIRKVSSRRTNNRKLYESIMKDVSKTIKRRLNENRDFDDIQGDLFKVDIYIDSEVDDEYMYVDITPTPDKSGKLETIHFEGYDDDLAYNIGHYIIDQYF